METVLINNTATNLFDEQVFPEIISTDKPFIQANTIDSSLQEIRSSHVIPVFIKDNEPVISHGDFIEATMDIVSDIYSGETILHPSVRLSHPIKGRIPEAKDKPLGVASLSISPAHLPLIRRVQNDLFDMGADLATPDMAQEGALRITAAQVACLETARPLKRRLSPAHLFCIARRLCKRGASSRCAGECAPRRSGYCRAPSC